MGRDQHLRKLKEGYLTEELETEEGGILETGEVELDETETGEGVGVWEVLGDGVVEVVVTRGSLTTAAPPCSSVF